MSRTLQAPQLAALERLLGRDRVLLDEASRAHYGSDWSTLATPDPVAIVFPQSTAEVQALLRCANEWHWPLVPSGGRTGLSGAAVAAQGEIVVSLERMNRILDFDPVERIVSCEPGVVTAQLQQFAREQGLYYPIEFASDGSSQLGGNIATNAGGIRVLRYGMTRAQVAGLEVISGAGHRIDDMNCLRKDNAGYSLRELFIGSEGTLGITTRAGLWLAGPPPELATALVQVNDEAALPRLMQALRTAFELHACELMDRLAWEQGVQGSAACREIHPAQACLLVEAPAAALTAEALSRAMHDPAVSDVLLANQRQRAALWAVREGITAALRPQAPLKFDLGFRSTRWPEALQALRTRLSRDFPQAQLTVFGHLGDGNLHANVTGLAHEDRARLQQAVQQVVVQLQGTLCAEHGIGLLRRDALAATQAPERLAVMRQLRQVFDPQGILNPGKLVV